MPFKKGHKINRGRTRKSQGETAPPNPAVKQYGEDEEMADGDGEVGEAGDATMHDDGDDDAAGTPAQDDYDVADSPPTITTIPRRRGRGRGPGRPSTRHIGTPEPGDDGSDAGTPYKRKRGRPAGSGRGGFRGRRKGQQPESQHVTFEGVKYDVVNDDAQIDQDPEGDEKVDENGNLQGEREYRVRTFKVVGKGDRLYMLSTEPARCCGFRDSYLFFAKHPKLFKVVVGDAEKKDLIERDILPNSYKGRNIGVVTARSVFREFGARIIVGGKRIIDDYKVAEARANGEIEGELADPNDRMPSKDEEYNRNRYVAWFGASEVYRAGNNTGNNVAGKPAPMGGKRRNNITIGNWQFMHAQEASRFNSVMSAVRKTTHNGVYDTHTNLMFMPKAMQPTHAHWEQIHPEPTASKALTNGGPNGTSDEMAVDGPLHPEPNLFSPVPPIVSRSFAIIDTAYTAPPSSNTGYPGPDGAITDPTSGTPGLCSVPADVADELPEDCRKAFDQAKKAEMHWKEQWGTEGQSTLRGGLRYGFSGYPV